MPLPRAALILLSSAFAALPVFSAPPGAPVGQQTRFSSQIYYSSATPLDEIPVYQMQPASTSADLAGKALDAEIIRLYTHAKTLPSGHDRRAFETRLYLFEKRLRPLAQNFDLPAWESLRADIRVEWLAIQATLPSPAPADVAVN